MKKNNFLTNVATLFAGNISAQLVAFISAPVITRLYSPSDFGIMAFVSSVLAIASVLACMRYERAIVLPKENSEAKCILQICFISTIFITILSLIIVCFTRHFVANIFGLPGLGNWLWFVPIGIFLFGIREPLTFWFVRNNQFKTVSIARFYLSLWAVLVKIPAALLFGASAIWLIIGNIVGLIGGSYPLLKQISKTNSWDILNVTSLKELINVAKKYKKFPTFSILTGFIHEFSQNIPILIFTYCYSLSVVGYYALAFNMLNRPVGLISESVTKVLLQKFAKLNSSGDRMDLIFTKATGGLLAIGFLPCLLLFFYGPDFFSLVFGKDWLIAGEFASVLSPWLLLTFIMAPATQIITVQQRLGFNLCFHIVVTTGRIFSFILGIKLSDDPIFALILFSATNFILYTFYVLFVLKISKK